MRPSLDGAKEKSHYNSVSTVRDKNNPEMPVMSKVTVDGVVSECFHLRRYFLPQLFQSFPSVLIVLSKATGDVLLATMVPI